MSIETARRHVLANLPATFKQLVDLGRPQSLDYRLIDRALQNLRKRGFITFDRKGRDCIWKAVEPKAA